MSLLEDYPTYPTDEAAAPRFVHKLIALIDLSQVSNKAASSVDKEKLLKARSISIGDILSQPSLVCWKNVMEYECT